MLILMGVAADTALRVRRTRIVVTKSKRVALRGAGLSTRRTGVTIAGEVQCDDYANWAIGRFSSRDAGAPPPRPGALTRRPGSPTRRPPAAPDIGAGDTRTTNFELYRPRRARPRGGGGR